jgi:hypothetical protein
LLNIVASFAFRGRVCALISSFFSSMIWIFGSHFVLKAIVTAQSSNTITIASEFLLREPIRMLESHFSIPNLY